MEVLVEVDGPVARVLIDRPEALNALSPAVLDGLRHGIDTVTEAGCPVLVLRGAGGTLSAGADLKYLETIIDDETALTSYLVDIGAVIDALEAAPFVTIAVVDGYALAGGCQILGLASHAVPAAELEAAVNALLARLTRHSGSALASMKQLYRAAEGVPVADALVAERTVLVNHLQRSPAAVEGLAALRAGRAPRFGDHDEGKAA